MKRNLLFICLLVPALSFNLMAQAKDETKPAMSEANAADVSSIDAIMRAVYDIISGGAGKKRDWNRFRTLFHPSARLIPSSKNPQTGVVGARALTPEEFIKQSEPFMEKEGFFEREIARRTDIYGNIAQVFSTYQSFHKADDKKPFVRGINSFQLLNDGKRWWVITIYWQNETPENPLPEEYLKSRKN
jgi:hypothetical protein